MTWVPFRDYLTSQLRQASTWRGLIILFGVGGGAAISPERLEAITLTSLVIAAAIGALFPDKIR